MASSAATLDRALTAAARTRALGLHFYGHFLGVTAQASASGEARLVMQPEPSDGAPRPASPVALATLADLAMGSAIRSRLGPGRRLATTTLAAHHLRQAAPGPVTANAEGLRIDMQPGGGFARCELRDSRDTMIAVADGWFLALTPPPGRSLPPVPWEMSSSPPVVPLSTALLDEAEAAAVAAAARAGSRADQRNTSVVEELLGLSWTEGDLNSQAVMSIGPEHSNRVGHVQGGVVYGIAALTASRLAGSGTALTHGSLQFLRPAQGAQLNAQARLLKRGGRVVFIEVRLSTAGEDVAVGHFTASGLLVDASDSTASSP